MQDKPFDTPVIVDLNSGTDREVKSAREALAVLKDEWPAEKRGIAYAEAVRSCRETLGGQYPAEKARDAFSAAAWDADVFVSDIRRLSEVLL
jgi:hypothetical protein